MFLKSSFCFPKKGSKMSGILDITVLKTCLTLFDSLRSFPLCKLQECSIFVVSSQMLDLRHLLELEQLSNLP